MKSFLARAICAAAALLLLAASCYSYSSYFARYSFIMAKRGQKTPEQYEALLRKALEHDPSYGYAGLELARLMVMQRNYGAALPFHHQGMKSFRPLRAYEQMGTIHARLGRIDEAAHCFGQTVRMHPHNLRAFEQLAWIAYEQKDSKRLDTLVDDILRLDMLNLNALYLRACDAERLGQTRVALLDYERISSELSREQPDVSKLLFDPKDVRARLLELRKANPAP